MPTPPTFRTLLAAALPLTVLTAGLAIAQSRPDTAPVPPAVLDPTPVASAVVVEPAADHTASAPPAPAPMATASVEGEGAGLEAAIDELERRLAEVDPGSPEADLLDTDLVDAVDSSRAELAAALDRFSSLGAGAVTETEWQRVATRGEASIRLTQLRRESFTKISGERRRRLQTLTREGIEQLKREARAVVLAARYYVAKRKHTLHEVPDQARDLFTVSAALTRFILVLLVLGGALWVRRRWRGWLERWRSTAFARAASVRAKRLAERLFSAAATVMPWVLFLATLAALRWALGAAAETTEVRAFLALLTVWGLYRLTIDVVAALLVGVAVRYGLDTTKERRKKLLDSVRRVLRVAALLVLVTLVSRGMGHGFLSSLIIRFAWAVVLVAIVAELFRWREVMVDTFLRMQPTGRLARIVGDSRTRWYAMLVAPAAVVWLAGRGLATVTRDFALGFEHTQKALAFLFRQRIQRQAEKQGYAEGAVEELPDSVIEAFQEAALEPGPLVVQNFPGGTELHQILSDWRDTGARGSYLLTGERGIGKTTWLNQIRREDLEIQRIELGRRATDGADLCRRISELLEIDAGADPGPRELGRALHAGPKRVLVLDMAQHLFLSDVGGYDAFSAFATLVNRTCNNVFWLCSMSSYAWRHLRAVRPDATVFRTRLHLTGWDEEEITELIRTRCKASGVRFNYADLVVDRLEGVSVRARLIESETGYGRLLWDYSDGNPRAALHFFLRSLDPDPGSQVRVRLFKAPDVDRLEEGGFDGLFVLAAIVTHESISLDDLVRVTRFDRAQCFIHIDRLLEIGAIRLDAEMYRITTYWHRAAVRLLRRRNLLPV